MSDFDYVDLKAANAPIQTISEYCSCSDDDHDHDEENESHDPNALLKSTSTDIDITDNPMISRSMSVDALKWHEQQERERERDQRERERELPRVASFRQPRSIDPTSNAPIVTPPTPPPAANHTPRTNGSYPHNNNAHAGHSHGGANNTHNHSHAATRIVVDDIDDYEEEKSPHGGPVALPPFSKPSLERFPSNLSASQISRSSTPSQHSHEPQVVTIHDLRQETIRLRNSVLMQQQTKKKLEEKIVELKGQIADHDQIQEVMIATWKENEIKLNHSVGLYRCRPECLQVLSPEETDKVERELVDALMKIRARIDKISGRNMKDLCVVCEYNKKSVMLAPCGHYCLCDFCARTMPFNKCPVCRTFIQEKRSMERKDSGNSARPPVVVKI